MLGGDWGAGRRSRAPVQRRQESRQVVRGTWVCSCQSRLLSWLCSEYVVKDDVGDSGDRHRGDYFERG